MCWMVRRPKGVEEYVSLPYSPPSSVYSSRLGRAHPCSRIGTADATLHGDGAECTTLQRAPAPPSLLKNFECRPILPQQMTFKVIRIRFSLTKPINKE